MKPNRILCLLFALIFFSPNLFAQQKICINGICYDVVAPVVSAATPAPLALDGMSLKSDTQKFKKALLESARIARRSGEIGIGQHLAIIAAAQRPQKLEEMKTAVHELAIEDGLATAQAIDWNQLIGFLEKLIPVIIQLIGLFK